MMAAIEWRMRLTKGLLRVALVLVLLVVLWHYFSGLDLSLVALRIRGSGFAVVLVVLPYAFVFLTESVAWRLTIRYNPRPGLGKLVLIRMATDALLYSIPGGVAVAEPMRPVLLQRQCGVELTEGIGSCIITKINIAVAQAFYVFVGFVLVTVFYPSVTLQLGVGEGITGYLAVGLSLLFAIGLLTLPFSGPRLTQLLRALSHIPLAPLRKVLAEAEPSIGRLDAHVGRFARDHTSLFAGSLLFSFAAWIVVTVETYLILKFLGADPTFTQAIALESTASILRILFFFLPGGLGASEVGFVTLLVAFGFPDPITLAAAYIAVKRLKEAGWVALGYLVFWFAGFNPFRRVRTDMQSADLSVQPTGSSGIGKRSL
jgi:uncharacterized membrane protein YbhN (UPF0104 family)